MEKFNISIVIPIFNEINNIEKLTFKIIENTNKHNYEIIFVDDNSLDGSKILLKKLQKKINFFKPIYRNKKKRDLTQSCFEGIKKSKYENIIIMDGDMQHDPKFIDEMILLYQNENVDLVVGARPLLKGPNSGLSETRRLISKIIIYLFFIFKLKTIDPMSGFFLFKKKIFLENEKYYFGKGFKILADILINSKPTPKSMDCIIDFKRRLGNKSKMNIKILIILINFYFYSLFKRFQKLLSFKIFKM